MSIEGCTQREIAEALGVSQAAVSKILARVEQRVLEELNAQVRQLKARQYGHLSHLLRQSLQGWTRSHGTRTVRRQRRIERDGPTSPTGYTVSEMVVQEAAGDPRHLEVARHIVQDIRTLLGLDPPRAGVQNGYNRPLEQLSEEELLQRLKEKDELLRSCESADRERPGMAGLPSLSHLGP